MSSPAKVVVAQYQTKDRIKLKGPARRSQEDTNCNAGIATKREEERLLAGKGDLTEALPEFSPNEGVHYAGVLLALPFLAGLSYLDTGKKVYCSLKKAYYGLQSIFLTPDIGKQDVNKTLHSLAGQGYYLLMCEELDNQDFKLLFFKLLF